MPMDEILLDCEEKMESAVSYLRGELRGVRTGRASAGLVDHLKVDYYGSPTDLRQLASIAVPEPTMIMIKPFDPSSVKDIEKAILAANIGMTPMVDGKLIRLNVPALSTERREQLAGQIRKTGESTRVVIRNARRDANKVIEREQKEGLIAEDDAEKGKEDIQDLTKKYEGLVTSILEAKTEEIMEA
ncbi:MAG: ribosome recycling factor [Planctomycetes bacterium]|nr:ribosome recycling factor [Planctomycetota bacterium]